MAGQFELPAAAGRRPARRYRLVLSVLAAAVLVPAPARAQDTGLSDDLTAVPLEQLLQLEVFSASRFVQKVSEAPSAVTVITAADIRTYGYRTLAEILQSMRGVYVTNDHNYSYVGVRGFSRPGDYNTRVLLQIDGYRLNDNVYDGALIGSEFILDVDLIERVEFVPGPGSAVYGGSAFFGVINVITKKGQDMAGLRAATAVASNESGRLRLSYGQGGGNGADLLLSASAYASDGQDRYFPEFDDPATNNGVAQDMDSDRSKQLFVRASDAGFVLDAGFSSRNKGIPTAAYGQIFSALPSEAVDRQYFINLGYSGALSPVLDMSASLYYGQYRYEGDYIYDNPPVTVNRDETSGSWWGGEFRLMSTAISRHKLIGGMEYRKDIMVDQLNYDVDPYQLYVDDRRDGYVYGVYLQDEFSVTGNWIISTGVRHDTGPDKLSQTNPRIGVIHRINPQTTTKLLYGSAYRVPNAYEKYYVSDTGNYKANPDLYPEEISTVEAVLEYYPHNDLRTVSSIFSYRVDGLIGQVLDPSDNLLVFRNIDSARAVGVELEAERLWGNGARLRASYTWQRAEDSSTGLTLSNSPRNLAKLNLGLPLPRSAWRAGLEAQYTGKRDSSNGYLVEDYVVVNVTLHTRSLARNLSAALGIYNLFDREYANPSSSEHYDSLGRSLNSIPQDGRTYRLNLGYRF